MVFLFLNQSSFSQDLFTSEELQSDARLLWQALNELHPGLYRHIDTVSLERHYEELLQDFCVDRTEVETFILFTEFVTKIKCGHSYLNPFNQNNDIIKNVVNKKVLLPFGFSIVENQMLVNESFETCVEKREVITHINNIEVGNIIDSLSTYIKADGDRKSKRVKDLELDLGAKFNYFDYYFPMIFEFEDRIKLKFKSGLEQEIKLLNKSERSLAYSARFPNANLSTYDDTWNFEFFQNYAYLQLGNFATWKLSFDWEEYLDIFFEELSLREIENLVIDIRGNEGGMSDVSDHLIKKIAKKEGVTVFRKPHLAYKKVSANLKPHVSTWSKWFYNTSLWTKKLNTTHRTIKFSSNKEKKIKRNKEAFSGQTYLLVNESNSSATFILAEICKKNSYATLVGTETGGTKMGITGGQIFFLNLPNTKIEIDIPLIGRYPMTELPDEGIQPDILVAQSLTGYLSNTDDQLAKVISIIEGN